MPDIKKEFRFDYKKYESKKISLEKIDQTFEVIVAPATSNFQIIAKGIQLLLAAAYIFIRKSLINEKLEIAKQEYESGRSNSNADDIAKDDLD